MNEEVFSLVQECTNKYSIEDLNEMEVEIWGQVRFLTIDLEDTELASKNFQEIHDIHRSEEDWTICRVKNDPATIS